MILNRDLSHRPVDLRDPAQVQEFVAHSWYDYASGKKRGLHPRRRDPAELHRPEAAVRAARGGELFG